MMLRKLFAILLAAMLCMMNVHATDRETELAVAGSAAVVGAVVGGSTFAVLGTASLAIASAAATIGAAPFIAAGAVVGLAGYGAFRTSHTA